ncbi:DUF3883 domain-containing protein [Reyranella sp.]|uniref:DUF3883 domain-containing protein n=1 Tax=Reyranella sp. TaxID=1929291 RepID=UPI003BA941E8
MVDDSATGRDWSSAELDQIVADYFAILREEQSGSRPNKAAYRRALMERIGRSNGSIEFKHQNISAVLTSLGLPRIKGYLPRWNFQGAIAHAIGRYLQGHPDPVPFEPGPSREFSEVQTLFEEAPPITPSLNLHAKQAFERVARKFDPALRDERNRVLGLAGEKLVLAHEREKLDRAARGDLAKQVRWVSQDYGDGLGYDILSYEPSGAERWIEVKTTRGGGTTPFYLTRNENEVSRERPDAFRLYRLYDFSERPRLFTLSPPLENVLHLETLTFRASLK